MPLDMKEVQEALRTELTGALEKRDQKSTELHEQIEHLKSKAAEDSTDIKGRIDTTNADIEKISAAIDAVQKKMDRAAAGSNRKSLGQRFIDAEAFKGASTSEPFKMSLDMKDITNADNLATGVTRSVLVPEQDGGMTRPPEQELRVRGLMPSGQTSSNSIRTITETGFTNSAAPVAEGGAKPLSDITFGETITPVQKIAHKFMASMEILDDAPMVRSYIDGRGRYGLLLQEEAQLLTGDGTGSNLSGILPQATDYAAGTITGYTPGNIVDDIRVAKLQVRKALYPASGVVMNPEDWASIELLKDNDDQYLHSMVTTGATQRLWGMPVVTSDSMPVGSFLVGAFSLGAMIWDRMGLTVMISSEDGDNFSNNMVTILFEERLALEVSRPEAFVYKAPV